MPRSEASDSARVGRESNRHPLGPKLPDRAIASGQRRVERKFLVSLSYLVAMR